jgi:hypothetical protein
MTNLSPAARTIVQAFDERHELLGPLEGNWQEVCLAAALRAAADQVVPTTVDPRLSTVRSDLMHIAAELESL